MDYKRPPVIALFGDEALTDDGIQRIQNSLIRGSRS
jgi:hypothetical protein